MHLLNNGNDKNNGKRVWVFTLILSLFIHIGFLVSHISLTSSHKISKVKKQKSIRIVLQSKKKTPNQIVTTENSGRDEKPVDSRFLSEKNQTFDRQTTASTVGSFKAAGKGKKEGHEGRQKKMARHGSEKSKKKKVSKVKKKSIKDISFSDLAMGKMEAPKDVKENEVQLANLGLENGASGQSGLSANNDFVDDVPLGDMTRLNTIEYKYYGFYHRIKQKLEQYWGNSLREKAEALYRSGRRIPAAENRITSLVIAIDTQGNIVDINVKSTSGVSELDAAAIESFNKAGPFPNPPSGMMKDGVAKIEWGFVVKG